MDWLFFTCWCLLGVVVGLVGIRRVRRRTTERDARRRERKAALRVIMDEIRRHEQ